MTPAPRPRGPAAAPDLNGVPPAQRLATHVEAAIAQLQRGIREAATPSRELTDDELRLALIVDDLAVNVSDLELVGRELSELGR